MKDFWRFWDTHFSQRTLKYGLFLNRLKERYPNIVVSKRPENILEAYKEENKHFKLDICMGLSRKILSHVLGILYMGETTINFVSQWKREQDMGIRNVIRKPDSSATENEDED